MKTGSIYVRLSAAAGETNLSRDGMVADCRAVAQREGIQVVAVHVDDGMSGAIRDRPQFTQWLDDAREGRASVLIASHADRLTREGINAAALVLDVVEGKDATTGAVVRQPVRLVTVDGLDSEKDDEAFRWRFVIAAEVARGERKRIKERNKANKARLRDAGRHQGGGTPYGCKVVLREGADGRVAKYLEREDTEAEQLEHVARMLLARQPMKAALRWLDQQGIRTRRGNLWTSRSLRTTLSSDATQAHVLDPVTWLALERRLAPAPDHRKRIGGGRPPKFLLSSGTGVCGLCGAKLVVGTTRQRARYFCSGSTSAGTCGGVSIWADDTDAFVEAEYLAIYGSEVESEITLTWPGQDELAAAIKARDSALEALRKGTPTRTAFDAYEAAQADVERWEHVVLSSEPKHDLTVADETMGETWKKSSREDRWRIIHDALPEPVVVNTVGHGGPRRSGTIDTSRIVIEWGIDAPTMTEEHA